MESRRPEAFSSRVIRPQVAVSKTNLFNVQNWLQRREGGARTLAHFPSHLSVLTGPSSFISKAPRITPGLEQSYPCPVTPMLDQALLAGPPRGSRLHGPMRKLKAGHAVCFIPGQGLSPRAAPLASQGKGRACLFTRHPSAPSPAPPCLLPWIRAVHSKFPESECRVGWEEGRPGVPQPYCQPEGKSGPESERPREKIPSLERDQEHSAPKAPSVGLLQGCVSRAPTTHLCRAALPRGWSAPEATAALAHSSSV